MIAEMLAVWMLGGTMTQNDRVALRNSLRVEKSVKDGGSQPVAQFRPCVWPNTCAKDPGMLLMAQFTTCVWPHRCGKGRGVVAKQSLN